MNFVLAVTIYNFMSWSVFLLLSRLRYSFFTQRIHTQQGITTVRTSMHAFVYDYLQQDGFFILRLIHSNVGDDVTTNILTNLWRNFQRSDKFIPGDSSLGVTTSFATTSNKGLYMKNDGQNGLPLEHTKTTTNL